MSEGERKINHRADATERIIRGNCKRAHRWVKDTHGPVCIRCGRRLTLPVKPAR